MRNICAVVANIDTAMIAAHDTEKFITFFCYNSNKIISGILSKMYFKIDFFLLLMLGRSRHPTDIFTNSRQYKKQQSH